MPRLKDNDIYYIQHGEQRAKVLAELALMWSAVKQDFVLEITPETADLVATEAVWTKKVTITLKNSEGVVHDWYNANLSVSIADTSVAGTATIDDATPAMVNGVCTVTISGDAVAWLADETVTLTVANQTVNGVTVTGGDSVITVVAPE